MGRIGHLWASTLAVLAVCAIFAGVVQAASSEWLIEAEPLAEISTEEKASTTIGATEITVPGLGITTKCSKGEETRTIFSGGTDKLTLTLSECTVASSGCELEPFTASLKSELIQTGETYYDLYEAAKSGGPIAILKFKTKKEGKFCLLPKEIELTGTLAGTVPEEERKIRTVVFSEAITSKVNKSLASEGKSQTGLFYGKEPASFTGELSTKLTGAHAGEEWQRVPPTKLCKSKPNTNVTTQRLKCTAGDGYAGEIKGELPSGVGTLDAGGGEEITCNEVKYDGKFKENGTPAAVAGGINHLTYEDGGGACPSTLAGNPAVAVSFLNLPYSKSTLLYRGIGNPQGGLTFKPQPGNNPMRLKLVFGAPAVTCEYKYQGVFGGAVLNGTGGNSSSLLLATTWQRDVGGAACPMQLNSSALLTLKRPNPGNPDEIAYVAAE